MRCNSMCFKKRKIDSFNVDDALKPEELENIEKIMEKLIDYEKLLEKLENE